MGYELSKISSNDRSYQWPQNIPILALKVCKPNRSQTVQWQTTFYGLLEHVNKSNLYTTQPLHTKDG